MTGTQDKVHVVSFSGGRTSAYLVYLMEKKRRKSNLNVKYVYMDTGQEHLGNCVFCIKKGVNKVALAAKDEPEMAAQFIQVLESDDVRVTCRKNANNIMYRGGNSLSGIVNMYSDTHRDVIASTLRQSKKI